MTLRVIYPPEKLAKPANNIKTIFLAGSIEMGNTPDWQQKLIDKLRIHAPNPYVNINVLNPRRKDWNSNWEQSIKNPAIGNLSEISEFIKLSKGVVEYDVSPNSLGDAGPEGDY